MLIRTKILLVLFIFMMVIIIMGGTYFYMNNKQFDLFGVAEKNVEIKELLKTSVNLFAEQIKAYDYYVYLNENSEKHTFNEKQTELIKKLDIDEKYFSIEGLKNLNEGLGELNQTYKRSFFIINKFGKNKAIEQTENELLRKIEKIRNSFEELIVDSQREHERAKKTAILYRERTTFYSLLIFGIGMFVLSVLSFNLYSAIIYPLKKVEQAAKALGQGNLDYKIKIKGKNEFQNIAKSINQMAKDLKEFHLQVTQMGKMAAIGELAGGVAHEINNPLTGILGNIQILLVKVTEGDQIHEKLKKMERAAIRCRDIVSDLLDFSRREKSEQKSENINKVIEDTFTFCESEINAKNIKLVRIFAEELPTIKISERTIQQAFLNIINNAIQAMKTVGTLTIQTELKYINGCDHVVISFRDTGHGFTEETGKTLFDPFFTTREIGQGTGLGLSLTYRIIRNHKGFINGESEGEGMGAVFTIGLPVNISSIT